MPTDDGMTPGNECEDFESFYTPDDANITNMLAENETLKKRNRVLERAMEILKKPYAGKAMRVCEYALKQAQQEIESEDSNVSKR